MRDIDEILGLSDEDRKEFDKWLEKESEKEELWKEMEDFSKKEEAKRLTEEAFEKIAQAVELVRG